MSRLRLVHTTIYDYSKPVLAGEHRLIVRPREGHDLRVDAFEVRLEPAGRIEWTRDIFGNSVAWASDFVAASPRLRIVTEATLWRSLADPSPRPAHLAGWPVAYDPLESSVAEAYRVPVYPADQPAVRAWLEAGAPRHPSSAHDAVEQLCRRIRADIAYARRDEKGVYTPAQTLALRSGSCRDMAALFLEAGRLLGFAMRFASGYLECEASRAGEASTHAWVEAYLPELGWRGFDATSGTATTAGHIVAGVSNHPRGVMPVTGVYHGDGARSLGLSVSVLTERLDDPAAPARIR